MDDHDLPIKIMNMRYEYSHSILCLAYRKASDSTNWSVLCEDIFWMKA
jgi:hypothetical protein